MRYKELAVIDPKTLSIFLYEVTVLVDKGYKESIETVNKYMQDEKIIEYLHRKYPNDFDTMKYFIEGDMHNKARSEAVNKLFQECSLAFSGNERRKWGIENNGLCVLIAWCAEMMRDWNHFESILENK